MTGRPKHLRIASSAAPEGPSASEVEPQVPQGPAMDVPPDLDQLFRRYARYVGAIGLRLLGRPEEVDDLVQDVFLGALKGIGDIRDAGAIKAWLATVTVRTARRRLRRRRLHGMLRLDGDYDYEAVADHRATPEQGAQISRLYEVLDQIPAAQRVVWTLRYVEGEHFPAVALLCGCSVSTAKRRAAAAAAAIDEAFGR